MIRIMLAMGAVVLTAASPVRDPATFADANMIRIMGVCMEIRNDAQYDEYFSADFWRIDIKLQDTIGHIYIGWNPDLKGDNDQWRQRKKEKSIDLPVIVPLSGDQAGQFLGIPNGKRDPYFHLWFDKQGSEANDEILKLMGFC